jgi:hypothetical protein
VASYAVVGQKNVVDAEKDGDADLPSRYVGLGEFGGSSRPQRRSSFSYL